MSEFTNTVDTIGDAALTSSIIDRSVTEYNDNVITKVGNYAFYKCTALKSVNAPNATSIGSNGMVSSAFEGCTALESVNFPEVTAIGGNVFQGCTLLKTVYIPKLTSLASSNIFRNCDALASVDFPEVTGVGNYCFDGCDALSSVNLPKITNIGQYAFQKTALTSIVFPLVTGVDMYAFRYCASLKTADFPALTRLKSNAFQECTALKTLILRNTSGVCTLDAVSALASTPIANGTGYVYVPSDLVDSYKAATNWSTFANQFRKLEDWTVDGTVTGALNIENRHMVRFFNDDGTLLGYVIVATGSDAAYDGTPVCSTDSSWVFQGFEPSPTNVTTDMDCYAQYLEPFSLESASWARISEISAAGTAANYMSVGDTKSVYLNGTVGTRAVDTTLYVFILGFDHNSEKEGSGIHFGCFKSGSGDDGIDVCLAESGTTGLYASDGKKIYNMQHWGAANNGGWAACDIRYDILGSTDAAPKGYGSKRTSGATGSTPSATCATSPVANTLMAALPADLRAVMKPITKYTDNVGGGADTASNVTASVDYLPLLSEFEIYGQITKANSAEQNFQKQYQYYANGNSSVKYKHSDTGTAVWWWQRSVCCSSNITFCYSNNGLPKAENPTWSMGLAPVFMV